MATQTGGFRFDGTHYIELNKLFALPHNWVKDVEYDKSDNTLFLALGDDGVYRVLLDNMDLQFVSPTTCWRIELTELLINCQNSSQLKTIKRDHSSLVTRLMNDDVVVNSISRNFIDTSEGLFRIDALSRTVVDSKPSKYSRIDSSDNGLLVWRDGTLYYYDPHGKVNVKEWSTYPSAIAIDGNTALIAQDGKVLRISLFDFDVLNESISSSRKVVKHIFKDNSNNLWLVSTNSVEIVTKEKRHTPAPVPSAYNMKVVHKATEYVGTEKGVFIKNSSNTTLLGNPDDYGYVITDLELIGDSLFIASSKGLAKYDISSNRFESLFNGYIIVLNEIGGKLYVGTNDHGLYIYDGANIEPVKDLNAVMQSNEVVAIELIDNTLYVGTGQGFYTKTSNGAIEAFGDNLRIITGFTKADSGVYVATFGQGLYRFNNRTLSRLNTPQSISGVAELNQKIILGTISGLYIFDGSTQAVAGTDKLNITPNSLDVLNQTVTFGTQYGVDSILFSLTKSMLIPRIVGVDVDGEFQSQLPNELYANSHNRIYLAANSFVAQTEFQYKLGGEWQEARQGTIDLFVTQPNTYILEVRASQGGGTWSEPVQFDLYIKGEWYQADWFYIMLIMVVVLILLAGLFMLLRYLKSNFNVHEKLHRMYSFTNTHNLLAMMTKAKAKCSSPDVNLHADGLVYIDEVIDMLVPMAHGNAVLGKRTLQQGVEALKASFKYEAPRSEFDFVCSTEQGKTLPEQVQMDAYAVIYHSVKNSIEHGKASRIEVFVEQVRGTLQVNIVDDGIGCSWFKRNFSFGLGFFLMRQVARRNNTKLVISSCRKGTNVGMAFGLKVAATKLINPSTNRNVVD
ncbi:hypothetical protein HG263_06805 [Pseudoalteromonas sp. JBTF-M23]|uniref:Signal transduction histidine kinase n=1 Tax=Pseudoalteromonas caenipelagi TaxID=2726988 RepID=A0A849VA53_9GAMM|nr:hypothetical protein [Pseudoalteromonas caenipelagi]NOU50252.1 hypothetical protein [Pseudoalteromonas caenipelagi]